MSKFSRLALFSGALLVGSCGGDDSSTPPTANPGPEPTPTLTVTLSEPSGTIIVREGERPTFRFEASYSGTSALPIVADVTVEGTRVELVQTPTKSGNSFTIALRPTAYPAGGTETSEITFRLCTSASCSTVYPGSTKTFNLTLDVQLENWGMFQRNAAHTGYLPVTYDPNKFLQAWERSVKTGLDSRPVSADSSTIYVVEGRDDIPATEITPDRLLALDAADGTAKWIAELGTYATIGGASLSNGKLLITAYDRDASSNKLLVRDALMGTSIGTGNASSQFGDWMQPTTFDGRAFVAAGYYGSKVFGFDIESVTTLWDSFGSRGVTDGQSVAADAETVYYYSGTGVDLFDPATGVLRRTLTNQFYTGGGYAWESALMLDGVGGVFGMNGHRTWPYRSNSIVGYSTTEVQARWVTANRYYYGHPAMASGYIFALRGDARELHAIDARDGTVAWVVNIPGTGALRHNVVATANLVFVSGETDVYAFDISKSDRPMVWSAPVAGSLAITPDNLLVVAGMDMITAFHLY